MSLRSEHRPTVDAEAARTPSVIDALADSVDPARRKTLDDWMAGKAVEAVPGFLEREGEDAAYVIAFRLRERIAGMSKYGGEWPYAGASLVAYTRAVIEVLGARPIAPWVWAELFAALPNHKKVTAGHLGGVGRTLGVLAVPAMREAIRRKASFRSTLFSYLSTDGLLTDEEALIGITDPPLRYDAERYLAGRVPEVIERLRDMQADATKGTAEVIVRLLRRVDKRVAAEEGDLGELEIRLRETPDDLETLQVWADLLMERADPRGQLIALQLALANEADPARALEISGELATHCATYRKGWFGKPGGVPFRDKYVGRSYIGFGTTYRAMMRGKPGTIFDRVSAFVTELTDAARPRALITDAADADALVEVFKDLDAGAFRTACVETPAVLQLDFKLTWPGTKIPLPYQESGHFPDGGRTSSFMVYLATGKLDMGLRFPFEDVTDDGFAAVYQAIVETLGKIVLTPTGFFLMSPTADGKKMKRKLQRYAGPG